MSTMKQKLTPQTFDVIEGIGEFIEYWGFKKIHGKIWALIFLSEDPVDAGYLTDRLNVSKALISISLKDLMLHDVVATVPKKNGRVHYTSNPDLSDVIINVLLNREAQLLSKLKSSCELLAMTDDTNKIPSFSSKRIKKLQQMVGAANKALKTFITLKQLNFKDLRSTLTLER